MEISVPLLYDSTGLVIGAVGRTMMILQEITGCVLWVDTTCGEAYNVLLSSAKHEPLEMAARVILDVAEQRTSYDDVGGTRRWAGQAGWRWLVGCCGGRVDRKI